MQGKSHTDRDHVSLTCCQGLLSETWFSCGRMRTLYAEGHSCYNSHPGLRAYVLLRLPRAPRPARPCPGPRRGSQSPHLGGDEDLQLGTQSRGSLPGLSHSTWVRSGRPRSGGVTDTPLTRPVPPAGHPLLERLKAARNHGRLMQTVRAVRRKTGGMFMDTCREGAFPVRLDSFPHHHPWTSPGAGSDPSPVPHKRALRV